jgi:hypothetical protein
MLFVRHMVNIMQALECGIAHDRDPMFGGSSPASSYVVSQHAFAALRQAWNLRFFQHDSGWTRWLSPDERLLLDAHDAIMEIQMPRNVCYNDKDLKSKHGRHGRQVVEDILRAIEDESGTDGIFARARSAAKRAHAAMFVQCTACRGAVHPDRLGQHMRSHRIQAGALFCNDGDRASAMSTIRELYYSPAGRGFQRSMQRLRRATDGVE